MREKKRTGTLIVLSGPSGAGKSTVIRQLLQQKPQLHFSVSFTTRLPREGEKDGVNYHFVSRGEFQRMIAEGELLEWATYVDNYYGTSLKVITDHLSQGTDVLLDIEVQGAALVREKCPQAVLIFLMPPSMEELSRRLHGRGTDREEVIASRLQQARRELEEIPQYDYVVINDRVDTAVAELEAILLSQDCRVENRSHFVEGVLQL